MSIIGILHRNQICNTQIEQKNDKELELYVVYAMLIRQNSQ